jgi:FKBP-type peptidyl-prolyl cis-trans isomerase
MVFLAFLQVLFFGSAFHVATAASGAVVVETKREGDGPPVTRDHKYASHVTLYIENDDGSRTPSGWSTRQEDGAPTDQPYQFQPGVNLIQGWTEGVLQMKEGERADLHVPSELGYGAREMGRKEGGAFYIPPNSNLCVPIKS